MSSDETQPLETDTPSQSTDSLLSDSAPEAPEAPREVPTPAPVIDSNIQGLSLH